MSMNETDLDLSKRVEILEMQVSELRNMIVATKPTNTSTNSTEGKIVAKIKEIGVQDAVIFCMRIKGPQTKEQMQKTMDVWGLPYGSWFNGGNFNNRLLKKAIVKIDGANENGDEIYSLTMNGERIADEKLLALENKRGLA